MRPVPLRSALVGLVILVTLAGCGSDAPTPPPGGLGLATLDGTTWAVEAINDRDLVLQPPPTIAFGGNHVTGSTGCNSFGGAYRFDPATGSLAFDDVAMTLVGCAGARGTVEAALVPVLTTVDAAELDAQGRLLLSGPAGHLLLDVVGPTVTD
jgi:heat shock protein HslJ